MITGLWLIWLSLLVLWLHQRLAALEADREEP